MLDGLLGVATTYARLACYLGARPHDDNAADYEMVEDEFNEATQGFQQDTLERVLGWREAGDVVSAEQADVPETQDADGYTVTGLGSCHSRSSSPGAEEDDFGLGDVDALRSTGSSPVSDKQWDPTEDLYRRMSTSLIADLEDPLIASLTEPLVQQVGSKLQTSVELVSSLAATLSKDPSFVDAIAARVRNTGLAVAETGSPILLPPSEGTAHNTSPPAHSLSPSPTAPRRAGAPGHASGAISTLAGRAVKREGSSSPLLLDAKRSRGMVKKTGP
ncbi:hypothetical protein C8T65DRAFT_698190 [Cerioporus squamosus]|nr:hypothetical protein C8T65DRAFT_698190 [Cerioporus squamosus]